MALFASLSPDPIFRFNESGIIILANNSAHKILPNKLLVGDLVQNIFPFLHEHEIKDIIENEKTINYTTLLGRHYYQFLVTGVSKFGICQVFGRNITDLKKTEQELKEALVKAEESKKLKEYFLAQISHEIRSPLNVIVGYSDLLAEEFKEEKREELHSILKSIKNNSKRLYRTFDLLLNMSQLQTGKYEPRMENIDLHALLRTLHYEYLSLAEEKKLEFTLTNTLEDIVMVSCDHYSISQVFLNLLDNAIKYTKEGKVDIKIYRCQDTACVDISDTGKGMSKEFIDQLFIPFTQEEIGYTRRYDGTGLGLAIVKNFLDLNNAKIKVTSEPKVGSKFTVILSGDKKWGYQTHLNRNS